MTAFLAGTLFGGLFTGAVYTIFVTRILRKRDEEDPWPPCFDQPAPVVMTRQTISKRQYTL